MGAPRRRHRARLRGQRWSGHRQAGWHDWTFGGGILALDDAELSVIDCVVEGNRADLGAGIAVLDGAEWSVRDATIRGSSAAAGGGCRFSAAWGARPGP
jgi:hypothetical protein